MGLSLSRICGHGDVVADVNEDDAAAHAFAAQERTRLGPERAAQNLGVADARDTDVAFPGHNVARSLSANPEYENLPDLNLSGEGGVHRSQLDRDQRAAGHELVKQDQVKPSGPRTIRGNAEFDHGEVDHDGKGSRKTTSLDELYHELYGMSDDDPNRRELEEKITQAERARGRPGGGSE